MYYEINVSKLVVSGNKSSYKHYFATSERSITNIDELKVIYNHFITIFPEPEFNIIITQYEKIGHFIESNTILL